MDFATSTINFFGVVYVGIPILFMFVGLVMWIIGKSISKEYFDKIAEISKWYLVSVALVFAAKIIETGFSERETGIKEMQVYDNYVETILKADNIEARWKLAQYFSTVTPTDRLRDRWREYRDSIKADYEEFKELKSQEEKLEVKDTLSTEEKRTLQQIRKNLEPYENSLTDYVSGPWAVVFTGNKTLAEAQTESQRLEGAGISNIRIYFRDNRYRTLSGEFNDRELARAYLQSLRGVIRNDAYVVDLSKWCPRNERSEDYIKCN